LSINEEYRASHVQWGRPCRLSIENDIYSKVQKNEVMRVNLAQLCMEGGKIHFFNSLLNNYVDLTWMDMKKELLDRYD